jgi:hypothetical protein
MESPAPSSLNRLGAGAYSGKNIMILFRLLITAHLLEKAVFKDRDRRSFVPINLEDLLDIPAPPGSEIRYPARCAEALKTATGLPVHVHSYSPTILSGYKSGRSIVTIILR